jgi:hypothetical protein
MLQSAITQKKTLVPSLFMDMTKINWIIRQFKNMYHKMCFSAI